MDWAAQSFPVGADGNESIKYTNGKAHWNICEHTKATWEKVEPLLNLRVYNGLNANPAYRFWLDYTNVKPYLCPNGQAAAWFTGFNSGPVINEKQLASDGVANIWPQIDQQVSESVANAAFDARKLPGLVGDAKRMYLKLRWLAADVRKHSSFSPYNLSVLIKSLAQSNLAYQYSIKTTYGDLKDIYSSFLKVREQLNVLEGGQGKLHHQRYTARIPGTSDDAEYSTKVSGTWAWPYVSPLGANGSYTYKTKVKYAVARHTTHLWYTYTLPDMSRTQRELGALLDSLGLNLNPKIAWDALKYSFVVDWILRVGDFLDQFKLPWIRPVVNVERCWTVLHLKKEMELQFSKSGLYGDSATVIDSVVIGRGVYEQFVRKPSSYGFLSLVGSGLSKYEIVMLSSLLGARVKG
jgi:hypothetical protein